MDLIFLAFLCNVHKKKWILGWKEVFANFCQKSLHITEKYFRHFDQKIQHFALSRFNVLNYEFIL